MPNAKIGTLTDGFTAAAINTGLWGTITTGTATLDTFNDQIVLAVPTTATTNVFGTSTLYDATGSSVYAQITPAALGNGNTRTIMRLRLDVNNSISMRIESGVFRMINFTGGVNTNISLPAYDAHAHRWWRLREAGGIFYADTSPDGLTWTTLASTTYTWDATALTLRFESVATATEVAGNASVIAHVNTRSGGQANPNWPYVEHGAGLRWGANSGVSPLDLYVDVSTRTQGATSVSRGRQYELDQVRAGEESSTLANTDGALDPTSATSPFAGSIQPFQPYRIRAQWPPTVNLISQGIATGGDTGGVPTGTITPSAALDLSSDTDSSGGTVTTSTSAWLGSAVTQFSVPNATASGQRIAHTAQVAVQPGQTYTVSIRVRDITASTSLQVQAHLGWFSTGSLTPSSYAYGTASTLTGAPAAGWTTLTVTGTAPTGTYGIDIGVSVAATAAAACVIQTDGWQAEKAATASAWVCPGAWYPVMAGFTEDWQSQWEMGGTFGTVTVPAADAFSLLSQQQLSDPLTEEINSHNPTYLYTLADPEGAAGATDQTGTYPALPIAISKSGAGTLTFGNAITATNTTTGIYTGATGTVANLNNASPGSASSAAASFFQPSAIGIKGPATSTYSRMIAFRYTGTGPSAQADLWTAIDNQHGTGTMLALYIDSAGKANATTVGASSTITLTSAASVNDGNWHLAVIAYQIGASGSFALAVDGVTTGSPSDSTVFPSGLVCDTIGTYADSILGNTTKWNFAGDISYIAEFPVCLTPTDCTNLYTAWRSACAGESTDARYARILRYAGYTGPTSLQAGQTTSMGPLAGGQDAVSALNAVVETENGEHYIARDGTPTFRSRAARYNALTPTYVFGERGDLGEWPYSDIQAVWDSTHLGNIVTVTDGAGQQFYARDTTSIAAYFPRDLSRTVNSSSALECQDAADYLLARYKAPLSRLSTLRLVPSANPAMWPVCLSLELGTRVRVMRRPTNLPVTQIDCFVENIAWSFDDQGNAAVTLQCSPADLNIYGVWAAWHTTLASSIASGVSTITVNASADTTNPLGSQLAAGQLLVLGQNTAAQETVTVQSVGASSPGWTTATIILTAPTSQSHTAGDLVNEPLPTGATDPTLYDPAAAWDAVVYAY
jgi:hypothetical protein